MDKTSTRINKDQFVLLLVGGDYNFREVMHGNLKQEGYLILDAKNRNEAEDYLNTQMVHILLLNLSLSDLSGMEVLQYTQSKRENWQGLLYIIVFTANPKESEKLIKELG